MLEPYNYIQSGNPEKIDLRRFGHFWQDDSLRAVRIDKRFHFSLNSEAISIGYCLTAMDEDIQNVRFAVENNFNFQAGHAKDRYLLFNGRKIGDGFLDAKIVQPNCFRLIMKDEWRDFAIALMVDKPAEVWQGPIQTVSLSENGFEKLYQGTSLSHIFNLSLKKGEPFEIGFLLFAGRPETMPQRFQLGTDKAVAAGQA